MCRREDMEKKVVLVVDTVVDMVDAVAGWRTLCWWLWQCCRSARLGI